MKIFVFKDIRWINALTTCKMNNLPLMGHLSRTSFYWVFAIATPPSWHMARWIPKIEDGINSWHNPSSCVALWFTSYNIFSTTTHANLSSSVFHLRLRALSVGSHSSSTLTTDLALSDSGITASTSLWLLCHFLKRKPPFSNNLRSLIAKIDCFFCGTCWLHHVIYLLVALYCRFYFCIKPLLIQLVCLPKTEGSNALWRCSTK